MSEESYAVLGVCISCPDFKSADLTLWTSF